MVSVNWSSKMTGNSHIINDMSCSCEIHRVDHYEAP